MPDIAPPVLEYIYDLLIRDRSPAFLLLDQDGHIRDWGGKPEFYAMTDLKKGDRIKDHLLMLDGLFPLDEEQMILVCVEMENGVSADIHMFQEENRCWTLFLDATEEKAHQAVLQQKINDLCLLRDKHAKLLKQHIGREIAEKLLRHKGEAIEESRYVSVLFANVRGFTAYSEERSSKVFKMLNTCLTAIIQPVLDEGGVVDKIIGETVMAIFGIASSDISPSVQSLTAGFQIIENMHSLQKIMAAEGQKSLGVGIGIASGQVFIGVLGSRNRKTLSAVGPSVNLASFLESQTRSNEILLDKNTFRKIDDFQKRFARATLRGIEGPLEAFSWESEKWSSL